MPLNRTLSKSLKRSIFRILTQPGINQTGRRLARRYPQASIRLLGRSLFPYVGDYRWEPVPGKPLLMRSDGTDNIVTCMYLLGAYEAEVSRFWLESLRPGMRVLDVGAHTGYFSLLASCFEGVRVMAVEPVPRVLRYLRTNLALNRAAAEAVTLIEAAVSDHSGEVEFYELDSVTLPLGSSEDRHHRENDATLLPFRVKVHTLDDLLARHGFETVDLIKIDTESTEPQVLAGMRETLARCRPTIICEVLSDKAGEKLEELLGPMGYQYFKLTSQGLQPESRIVSDNSAHNHVFKAGQSS